MKVPVPISLTLGGLALMFTLIGMLFLYAEWLGNSNTMPEQLSNHAAYVNAAKDFASLQHSCLMLAQSQDSIINMGHEQKSFYHRATYIFAFATLLLGLTCGFVLWYLRSWFQKYPHEKS